MVEVSKELIESVDRRQELIEVTQMVLAELAGSVAHRLERCGNGRRLGRHSDRRSGLANRGQSSPDRQLACNEVGATSSAGSFSVVVGETHPLGSKFVE